ncbi:MAG: type II secretion system F family protein [Clostridia bacterium]|nr:type II secretion system F family protein [Clostridia bacterium]
MYYEYILPSILTVGITILIISLKLILRRDIDYDKFMYKDIGKVNDDYSYRKEMEKIKSKIKIPAQVFILLFILGGIVISFITYIITGKLWISLIAFAGGFFVPDIWYKNEQDRVHMKILLLMEQAAESIAEVINSGGSNVESLSKAAERTKSPLKEYLTEAALKLQVGVNISEVYLELMEKIEIDSFLTVAIAYKMQEQGTAVNIPELFREFRESIREEVKYKKDVSAATTESKISGIVVALMAFGTIGMIRFQSPEFIEPLFNTHLGLIIFTISSISILVGLKWIQAITRV